MDRGIRGLSWEVIVAKNKLIIAIIILLVRKETQFFQVLQSESERRIFDCST
jgi:hypothetical protein